MVRPPAELRRAIFDSLRDSTDGLLYWFLNQKRNPGYKRQADLLSTLLWTQKDFDTVQVDVDGVEWGALPEICRKDESDFFLAWTQFTALNQYWWFGCWWWCWIMRSELPSANRIESATCFKAGHSHFNASLCILKQSLHLKNDWQKTRWGKKSKPVKNLLNTQMSFTETDN